MPENINLITDRTQEDVNRALYLRSKWVGGAWTGTQDELAEWNTDLKGSYNASDLNRVGNAMLYLAERMNACGYSVTVSPKPDFAEGYAPKESEMDQYLADLSMLRGVLPLPESTPEVPDDMKELTYIEANNIEQILFDMDRLLTNMSMAWFYSGDLYSGEI